MRLHIRMSDTLINQKARVCWILEIAAEGKPEEISVFAGFNMILLGVNFDSEIAEAITRIGRAIHKEVIPTLGNEPVA